MTNKISTECFENTNLSSNMEDYIEAINILARKSRVVRVRDIARFLKIKMPSVTSALNKLEEKHLIYYEKYGYIELTKEGQYLADKVYSRHSFLFTFFKDILGINEKDADEVACKVEHHLSPLACRQLYKFITFFRDEEKNCQDWIKKLNDIMSTRRLSELSEGDSAVIQKIEGDGALKKRLNELGFRKGEPVKIIKYAPLNDPLKLTIKDYNLSIRVEEAKTIIVTNVLSKQNTENEQ